MKNLNKFIADAGLASRREADRLIKAGLVKINDKVAIPIDKVGPDDHVFLKGKEVSQDNPEKIYLAFNKPYGVISTTDKNSNNNIMSYIKIPQRVFPVGRLDVKSEGLILLTNDGDLAQQILKGKKVEKEYEVTVDKIIDDGFLANLEKGVKLDNFFTLPAKVEKINDRVFRIIIVEGKKRQIRRMCDKFHYNVIKLVRIRIGKIMLDEIKPGKFIEISPDKIIDQLGL